MLLNKYSTSLLFYFFGRMDDKLKLNEIGQTDIDSKNKDDSNKEIEQRMGIRSWRPEWMQKFNNIKWFMLTLALASTTQGNLNYT